MPLQHTHTEGTTPLTTLPTESQATEAAPFAAVAEPTLGLDTPRYDAATVQSIIALAEQMQTHHRETLSPAEVEVLGHEVGVEPEFVRMALTQVEARPAPAQVITIAQDRTRRVTKVKHRPVSRRQFILALGTPHLYLLFMALVLGWRFATGSEKLGAEFIPLYFVLPSLLAFGVGVMGKSKRVGAVSGGLLGLVSTLAMIGMVFISVHEWATFSSIVMPLAGMAASGAALGLAGAVMPRVVHVLRHKRFRVRLLVEPDSAEPVPPNYLTYLVI